MNLSTHQDPYVGLAASIVTSGTIDLRDTDTWTLSWYTTAGTSSVHTVQVSNASTYPSAIPEASWGSALTFAASNQIQTGLPQGVRYGRLLRNPSGGSYVIDVNRQVRS